jgi:hypothetical protein
VSYEQLLTQNLAAESDYRTASVDFQWWDAIKDNTARFLDGRWVRVRFEVCPTCKGRGEHVNPSIDANGLTREDFDQDPGFAEGYFRGDYNVACYLCDGLRVVPVPLDEDVRHDIETYVRDQQSYRAEVLAEMNFGA